MTFHEVATKIGEVESLERVAEPLQQTAKKLIPPGPVKDLLHGAPVGHPLHPALTDLPIGSFAAASVLDLFGRGRFEGAVESLLALGIGAAVPTAAAGMADWSETYGSERRVGLVHALSNVASLSLFAGSLAARRTGRQGLGRVLSLAGLTTLTVGGYLGGHLIYSRGVGVNNAFFQHEPEEWTPVMEAAELPAGTPTKVEADGATVLLYRAAERIYAIGSRCSHAGGPLQEGKVDDGGLCVQCPWHGSVFRLEDGTVVHGPASIPQAAYEVRVREGRIEVRHQV